MEEDYEITNTAEWDLFYKPRARPAPMHQGTTTWRRTVPVMPQHGQPLIDLAPTTLFESPCNLGEAEFRNGQRPTDVIDVPARIVAMEDNAHEQIGALASQHDAFAVARHSRCPNANHFTANLYGSREAVALAKQAILEWMGKNKPSRNATGRASFAKLQSLTPELLERAERRWWREVQKYQYREHPPLTAVFEAVGSFVWPVEESDPQEVLGPQLEALDPVRMDCSCYIVWYKDQGLIKVMGGMKDVPEVLLRLRQTYFQFTARNLRGTSQYLLFWDDVNELPGEVYLQDHKATVVQSSRGVPPSQDLKKVCSRNSQYDAAQYLAEERTNTATLDSIKGQLLSIIPRLQWYRGFVRLRLRLGAFLADQYHVQLDNGDCNINGFKAMIVQSQFMGHVSQELGSREYEGRVHSAFCDADDLLMPRGATIRSLGEVRPIFVATFVFAERNCDLVLTAEWEETSDLVGGEETYHLVSKRWYRRPQGDPRCVQLVDINVLSLQRDSAWRFGLTACQAVEEAKLSPDLLHFAERLCIDPSAAISQSTSRPFTVSRSHPGLRFSEHSIVYRYDVKSADYIAELSRFQLRRFNPRQSLAHNAEPTVYEPRWAVNVYRSAWDTMFASNESLAIGKSASWPSDKGTWFPPNVGSTTGDGIAMLMENLSKIEKVVRSPAQDLLTGMTIG